MCLYPRLIKNRKYTANKKNGGNIPAVKDLRTELVPIGCNNCIECRKQKSRSWQVRLLEDIKTNTNGKFITLTFNNKSYKELSEQITGLTGYDLDNQVAILSTRLFLERWRKEHGKSLRHWLVTELGHNGTENIHMHGIIWTNESLEKVEKTWGYGYMWKGKIVRGKLTNYVNDRTIGYITKYVTKIDFIHKTYKSKILTSPGIGKNYTDQKHGDHNRNKYNDKETNETYRTTTGHKISLPIYWRNKIYSEEEREKLWLNKLDKEIRYILGNKVDVSKGYEEYERGLKHAQKLNKELGYGDLSKDYDLEQYERARRMIMHKTRLEKYKTPSAGSIQKG